MGKKKREIRMLNEIADRLAAEVGVREELLERICWYHDNGLNILMRDTIEKAKALIARGENEQA